MPRSITCGGGRGLSRFGRMVLWTACVRAASGCVYENLPEDGEVSEAEQELGTTLQVEQGTRTGMLDRPWGAIMDGAGDRVCWSGVSLAGVNSASVRFSNGEGAGDSVDVTYNGASLGKIALPNCGAWEGDCGTASVSFGAQSGTGGRSLVSWGR